MILLVCRDSPCHVWLNDRGKTRGIGMRVLTCTTTCRARQYGRVGWVPGKRWIRNGIIFDHFTNSAITEVGQFSRATAPCDGYLNSIWPVIGCSGMRPIDRLGASPHRGCRGRRGRCASRGARSRRRRPLIRRERFSRVACNLTYRRRRTDRHHCEVVVQSRYRRGTRFPVCRRFCLDKTRPYRRRYHRESLFLARACGQREA